MAALRLVMTDVAGAVMSPERLAEKAAERVLPWAADDAEVGGVYQRVTIAVSRENMI